MYLRTVWSNTPIDVNGQTKPWDMWFNLVEFSSCWISMWYRWRFSQRQKWSMRGSRQPQDIVAQWIIIAHKNYKILSAIWTPLKCEQHKLYITKNGFIIRCLKKAKTRILRIMAAIRYDTQSSDLISLLRSADASPKTTKGGGRH